jgi:hypothetical protein
MCSCIGVLVVSIFDSFYDFSIDCTAEIALTLVTRLSSIFRQVNVVILDFSYVLSL